MTDQALYATAALSGLGAVGMISGAALTGWRGWLQLKRTELDHLQPVRGGDHGAGARIEIADLKERIRKLEAIAAGVDL